MSTTRLIFIRHGQGAADGAGPDGRMVGRLDVPLNDLGRRQARAVRDRMALEAPDAPCYASPLSRALETARIAIGVPLPPSRVLASLSEIDCGAVEGMCLSEVQARYPEHWAANLRQDDPDFRWPGGESYREMRDRCLEAVHRIAREQPGGRVVVVTHTGVISQILGALEGLGPESWERNRPGPASITEVDWIGDTGVLIRFDDRKHLARLEG